MVKSEQQKYETDRSRIQNNDKISDSDRKLIMEFLDAADPDHHMIQLPDGKTKSPGTLSRYATALNRITEDLEIELDEATDYDINSLMDGYFNGTVEGTKDSGLTGGTLRNREGPLRVFYRYHGDLNVDPKNIFFHAKDDPSVDERDMFDSDDIEALRNEAKRRGVRDACLIDLLLYTGQRISAILNLRLKDMNVEDGTFYLNEEAGDLKGASGKRPLLGAQKAVRDWKQQHPTGDPDDFLITLKRDWDEGENLKKGDRLARNTASELVKRIGESAGVEKPCHCHNYRHNFVTLCKKQYDLDDETVKHLIGHKPQSTVMSSTYSHLTDDDYIQKTEEKFGIREPEEESPFTPNVCDVCNEPLQSGWGACPGCGATFSPKAYEKKKKYEEQIWDGKSESEHESIESGGVDELRRVIKENPELIDKLT